MRSIGPWAIRGTWLVLPLLAGPAFAAALDDRSRPVQVVASTGLWLAWAAVLVATLVPRAWSLTAVRLAAPGALAAAVAAAVDAAVSGAVGGDEAAAVSAGVLVVAAAWWAVTADAFVDGSSYGDERRFSLRTPLPLLGPAAVAWFLAVPVPAAAALAPAAGAWLPAAVLTAAGAVGLRLGVPALHRLSRRWLVLVPAGLVVHDHLALPDPILFRRGTLRRIAPATSGASGAADAGPDLDLDLGLGAAGLMVELVLAEPTELPVAEGMGRRRRVVTVEAGRVLVVPSRPGAFLAAAAERRLPVA